MGPRPPGVQWELWSQRAHTAPGHVRGSAEHPWPPQLLAVLLTRLWLAAVLLPAGSAPIPGAGLSSGNLLPDPCVPVSPPLGSPCPAADSRCASCKRCSEEPPGCARSHAGCPSEHRLRAALGGRWAAKAMMDGGFEEGRKETRMGFFSGKRGGEAAPWCGFPRLTAVGSVPPPAAHLLRQRCSGAAAASPCPQHRSRRLAAAQDGHGKGTNPGIL